MSDLYQETLDVVLAHLRAQGKRALFWEAPPSAAICAYHTSDGLMCAIGVLMEPSLATTLTGTVRWLAVRQALKPQYYPLGETDRGVQFLRRLQEMHDSSYAWSPEGFNVAGEGTAKRIAEDYGLTYTPPETGESK